MYAKKLDERIQLDIQFELLQMPGVEPESVCVAVEAGVVTLTGHVADRGANDRPRPQRDSR